MNIFLANNLTVETMKKIFVVVFVFFFYNSYSQNLDSLDRKNGFKDLKLGMPYSKISSDLHLFKTLEDNSKIYNYTGVCCNKLFDYNLSSVQLKFYNDKLVEIHLKGNLTIADPPGSSSDMSIGWSKYKSVVGNFTQLFGIPTDSHLTTPEENTYCIQSHVWDGKKVTLFSSFWYEGDTYFTVLIQDKTFYSNNIKSGF